VAHRTLTAHLEPRERIICAYDKSTLSMEDRLLLTTLGPHIGMWKLGYQAQTARFEESAVGLRAADLLNERRIKIFEDRKFKDIKNTVTEAIHNLCNGLHQSPAIIILTDHTEEDALDIYDTSPEQVVLQAAERLLRASDETGLPVAMVLAPKELSLLQEDDDYDRLIKITPNIRAKDAPPDDQNKNRSMTVAEAIEAGADYLVIGRPILNSHDPIETAKQTAAEIASAL
jgi:orotidine-5'-phosphate decarboxylase